MSYLEDIQYGTELVNPEGHKNHLLKWKKICHHYKGPLVYGEALTRGLRCGPCTSEYVEMDCFTPYMAGRGRECAPRPCESGIVYIASANSMKFVVKPQLCSCP